MTPDRFAALAEAYGARPDRWPSADREAALAFLRTEPDRARAILPTAASLDRSLAAWIVPGPGAALSARVSAALEKRRALRRRIRLFLSGICAALTLAGGVAAGVTVLAMPSGSEQPANSLYTMSVLGEPLDPGDEPVPAGQTR